MRLDETGKSRADLCEEELARAILAGELKPGCPLKMEMLKTRLGCGLSPIREALSRLAQRGLIRSESNRGFIVEPFEEAVVADLFHAYHSIESMLMAQAIENGDAEWEVDIVAALHRLALVEKADRKVSYAEFQPANLAFHRALVAACGSPVLLSLRDNLCERFERCVRLAFDVQNEGLEPNHEEHREMAEAVIARDKKRALAALRKHTMGGYDMIVERLKAKGLL